MVAKARRNNWGDCIYDEQSLIEHLYQNPTADISQLYIENTESYLAALQELGIDVPAIKGEPKHNETPEDNLILDIFLIEAERQRLYDPKIPPIVDYCQYSDE